MSGPCPSRPQCKLVHEAHGSTPPHLIRVSVGWVWLTVLVENHVLTLRHHGSILSWTLVRHEAGLFNTVVVQPSDNHDDQDVLTGPASSRGSVQHRQSNPGTAWRN